MVERTFVCGDGSLILSVSATVGQGIVTDVSLLKASGDTALADDEFEAIKHNCVGRQVSHFNSFRLGLYQRISK